MESRLMSISFSFVLMVTFAQDNSLVSQETKVSHKSLRAHTSTNISDLEVRIDGKLRDTERRISRRFQDRVHTESLLQTQAVDDLQEMLEHMSKELHTALASQRKQTDVINDLQGQIIRHQQDMHTLKNSDARLKKNLDNLSQLVEQLVRQKEEQNNEVIESDPDVSIVYDVTNAHDQSNISSLPTTAVPPFTPVFPKDCGDVYSAGGMHYPGYYYTTIQPLHVKKSVSVCCKITTDAGWTLLQRRQDGNEDFYRGWADYKHGFGNLEGEFWFGLQHMYDITKQGAYRLRIEMEDWAGRTYWAEYSHFKIANENENYRLHVHGYQGNAGDSLTSQWGSHDKQPFSTHDRDNDNRFYDNCAKHYRGAWWFRSCFESHLNGVYYHKGSHSNFFVRNGIQWNTIHPHSSLKSVAMMIKKNHEQHHEHSDAHENYIN